MPDAMHLSFNIPCPENILWWIICIAFIGSLITGVMMLQAARFTLTEGGHPVSTQKFHRSWGAKAAAETLGSMSGNARSSMRWGIRYDYSFTPFFYGLMICLSILAMRHAGIDDWQEILLALCWLPVATFIFDLLEDTATLAVLNGFERKGVVAPFAVSMMTVFSLLKWLSGIVWLIVMVSLGVTKSVAAF